MPLIYVLSAVAAVVFTLVKITAFSQIWILPVCFIVCVAAFSLLFWLLLYLSCFFIPVKKEYEKPSRFYQHLLNLGYWFIYTAGRAKLHITGLEKIPKDEKFLFVSNHLSRFDNMIQCVALRKTPLAFITKPSNFKIPIGRHLMSRGCYISIDRDEPKSAAKSIARAAELIKRNYACVGVFPEGHRGVGYDLQEFKAGCLKTATKTNCPIVVSTICGTEKIHKNFPFHRTHVYFDILEVVKPSKQKTTELAPQIRQIMQNNLEKYKERR